MNIEIIRADGDLKREVWHFSLDTSYTSPCIYLNAYSFQTRPTTRYKNWTRQTHWERLDRRNNNIGNPPLATDIEAEAKSQFQQLILALPVIR